MKHLYVFSISIMFASHTLQSGALKLLPPPSSLITQTKHSLGNRCARIATLAKFLLIGVGGIIASNSAAGQPTPLPAAPLDSGSTGSTIYPVPPDTRLDAPVPPMSCYNYTQVYAYPCNACGHEGFGLDGLCVPSDLQSAETHLKAMCPDSRVSRIYPHESCSREGGLSPCDAWEPTIERINKICNPQPTIPQQPIEQVTQPTTEPIRQQSIQEVYKRYHRKLEAMATKRKGK